MFRLFLLTKDMLETDMFSVLFESSAKMPPL